MVRAWPSKAGWSLLASGGPAGYEDEPPATADAAQDEQAVHEGGDEGAEHHLVGGIPHEVAQRAEAQLGEGE